MSTRVQSGDNASETPRLRVLIVEDNDDLRFIVSWIFKHNHFDVQVAVDGLAALHSLEMDAPPDILILDINMPSLSGLDVLKYVEQRKLEDMKVIVVTGNAASEQHPAAQLADLFLVKPVDINALVEIAQELLEDARTKSAR